MAINDLFDMKVDKINNPKRPLITGEVTIREAVFLISFLLSIVEYLNMTYLPTNLQFIVHMAIVSIHLYTPLLKKITIVKNLYCAFLVSFSLFFTGMASSPEYITSNPQFGLLAITISFLFFGSLYNELLLDIRDYYGDKANNIKTIPVLIGIQKTWILAKYLLKYNLFSNGLSLVYLYHNYSIGLALIVLSSSLFIMHNQIRKEQYTEEIILRAVNDTNKTLFLMMFYLCGLAFYNR